MSDFPEVPGVRHRTVSTNGIELHVAEAGDPSAPPVILCHGFPELWYSWRHQLPALADAGYHAVAPDQRGYGRSSRPDAIEDYDIVHLTDDLVGLLDDLGQEQAVFVGHDWGAIVVWNLALLHPDRVRAVCGMSVPFSPRGEHSLTAVLERLMGDRFFYILHFQEPGKVESEVDRDRRDAIRRFLCFIGGDALAAGDNLLTDQPAATTTFWDWVPPAPELPPWLSEEELDVFASEFERTGFTGGVNWYRNFHRNWEITPQLTAKKVEMPSLFVAGDRDPVLVLSPPTTMEPWLADHRGTVLVPGVGHWVQQESPEPVNQALLGFLDGVGGNQPG
jgi:pimeloyl-ACP methyl ester carboxylesterase